MAGLSRKKRNVTEGHQKVPLLYLDAHPSLEGLQTQSLQRLGNRMCDMELATTSVSLALKMLQGKNIRKEGDNG